MTKTSPPSVSAHSAPAESSISRRKPKMTYQSPSGHFPPTTTSISTLHRQRPTTGSLTPSSTFANRPQTIWTSTLQTDAPVLPKKKKYPMSPPLPLYHPLGKLALSLPPLNAKQLGLPEPARPVQEFMSRSSARSRKPAAKVREVVDIAESSEAAISTAREVKERPSPRRKRAVVGSGGKRKRKEASEDGDGDNSTTYPAKRTTSRSTRGNGGRSSTTAEPESPVVSEALASLVDEPSPRSTPALDLPDEPSKKRRTRSTRRDSSASSASASVQGQTAISTPALTEEEALNPMDLDPVPEKEKEAKDAQVSTTDEQSLQPV